MLNAVAAPGRHPIVGVRISTTNYQEVADVCAAWVQQRQRWIASGSSEAPNGRYICVTSVHGIVTAAKNPEFRNILNSADIATPDGMPVVWALRSFGHTAQPRVYGPNLMLTLCERAAALGQRIYLYGARPETLVDLSANIRAKFPSLQIAGVFSPPFRPLTADEDAECTRQIVASGADIVFVGLSTPKQEAWMAAHRDALPGVILVGVGAAFDFHAGRIQQAPAWMQRAGLEWFFRLTTEPRRLWRRYLLETPIFLPLWALQKAGVLRYATEPGDTRPFNSKHS